MRINPREIHIKDPEYYDEIYAPGNRKRDKDPWYTPAFPSPYSRLATVDHDHHRLRKGYLKNFFLRKSLERLGPFIQQSVELLCQRFERAYHDNVSVYLDSVYADLTADVITYYSFGQSSDYLKRKSEENDISSSINFIIGGFHLNRFIPIVQQVTSVFPVWIFQWLQRLFSRPTGLNNMRDKQHFTRSQRCKKR